MLSLFALASAEEPEFAGAEKPGQAAGAPTTALAAQLGGSWSSGNTVSYTLDAALTGSRRWSSNKVTLGLGAHVGRGLADADGSGSLSEDERAASMVETARTLSADLRYDRFVGKRDSVYLLFGTLADPFSGYDNRSHAQAGFSRTFAAGPPLFLVAELGADAAREDHVEGVDPQVEPVYAARAMVGLTYAFSPNVGVEQKLEVYENILDLEDVRVLGTAALTGKLTGALSVRLSYSVTWDNRPVEGFLPVDTATVMALVAAYSG